MAEETGIKHDDYIVESFDGIIYKDIERLQIVGESQTFPFVTRDVVAANPNNPSFSFQLRFDTPYPVKVQFEEGDTQIFIPKLVSTGVYGLYFTANYYVSNNHTADYIIPIHEYVSGDNTTLRTVLFEYRKRNLINFSIVNTVIGYNQDLNFDLNNHPKIEVFNIGESFVDSIDITEISQFTNPELNAISFQFFSSNSIFSIALPDNYVKLTVNQLTVGTSQWVNAINDTDTNLHLMPSEPISQTLTYLVVGANGFTGELPYNLTTLPFLSTIYLLSSHIILPSAIRDIPNLTYLRISGVMSSWGGVLANISNLQTLIVVTTDPLNLGLPDNLYLSAGSLNIISYTASSVNTLTKSNYIIQLIFDLVNDNSTPWGSMTGGFKGIDIILTNSVLGGIFELPPDYVFGSTFGTIQHTGHQLAILQDAFYCEITL